jgi:hypothetical protein
LIDAISIYVRYELPNEKGETRRERNLKFEEYTPPFSIPESGVYLWRWYFSISDSLRRVREGICEPIPPSEYIAWSHISGEIINHREQKILQRMDIAFCSEMNKELTDFRTRREEEQKAEIEKARKHK